MGINLGVSGSDKDAYGSDRNLGLGEVPWSNYAPRMDLAYRLAQMANQQGAQSNLMFGGAGYGGSFESADQRAARAAGGSLNSKPYGGWGGYGSENPTLSWGGPGSPPPPSPSDDPVTGGTPVPISDGSGVRVDDGGAIPLGGEDILDPVQTGGDGAPWNQIPGYKPPSTGGGTQSAATTGTAPPGSMAAKAAKPNRHAALMGQANSPGVKQVQKLLAAQGVTNMPDAQDIAFSLTQAGGDPNKLAGHYMGIIKQSGDPSGYNAFVGSHGTLGRVLQKDMGGTPAGWEDILGGEGGGLTPAGAPQGQRAPAGGSRAPVSGGATGNDYEQLASMVASAGGEGSMSNANDPMKSFWETLQGGVGAITDSPAFKEWVAKQSWENQPYTKKEPGKATAPPLANSMATVPGGGQNVSTEADAQQLPPEPGESIYRTNKDGREEMWNGKEWAPTAGGGGAGGTDPYNSNRGGGPPGSAGSPGREPDVRDPDDPGYVNPDYTPGYFDYPAWGHDFGSKVYHVKDPVTGEMVEKVTPSKYQWDFNQGQNGGATPDAWSTSAPWRPEEPTGGLYGGYSDLASGNMTPYENRIGEGWQGLSTNPVGWADEQFQNQLAEYNKTPGKGIDEAFGAYDRMLKGDGYSAAEKGAIEGSAVRGLSQGFQRGADDMRRQAARTGQTGSAYAAMASMAPQFGATLGETNRQNQIKFADEAQRRQEVGGAGMTNVAGLANQKSQFGLQAGSTYANELARRKEAGLRGAGDYAAFGRGLQQQGLAGLNDLMKQSNSQQQGTYAMIANLLNQNTGSANKGSATGWGWGAGIGAGG